MITQQELKALELYPEFLYTRYAGGFRRVEYSEMLSTAEKWNSEKRHYYPVRDFFGETSAEECGAWCMAAGETPQKTINDIIKEIEESK